MGRLDLHDVFGRIAPLEIDLGCGGAGLIFERARNHPEWDFIGLEVRRPLVEAIEERRQREGLENVRVFYANAAANLADLVEPGQVRMFHVHFPDPCFKKRHHKRRIVQPELVRVMAGLLPLGGQVYLQSDVRALAEEMYDFMSSDGAFAVRLEPGVSADRPIPERTEWERQHERESEPVYRMLFEKVGPSVGQVAIPEFRPIVRPGTGAS